MDEDRVDGVGKEVAGSVKEAVGKMTGDIELEAEGTAQKTSQKTSQKTAGTAHAVGGIEHPSRDTVRNRPMSGFSASSTPGEPDATVEPDVDAIAMSLAMETVAITKRVRRTLVRASRSTTFRDQAVTADLKHEHVVVERVCVGRVVDAIPPVRQEGGVTIISVVEEEIVVTRRLVLKEEVHLRRVSTTKPHAETVSLRQQVVSVSRTPLDESA